jgi:hypothetical protein
MHHEPRLSKREINRQRWRERISAWKDSSQSQKAFCEERHLRLASFQRWRRIFKAEDFEGLPTATEAVRFVPVHVQRESPTILLQEDLRIEVPAGFDPHVLQQVIQVLRAS